MTPSSLSLLRPRTLSGYRTLMQSLHGLPRPWRRQMVRHLARTDLFFLLWAVMSRRDLWHPWLLARAQEVQQAPDGYIDLWARGHYKSTIITLGKSLQDILASHGDDPLPEWQGTEATIGIFSHTRPIAKAFLRQIKWELEGNPALRELFPDVVYTNPRSQSPMWSEDNGLVVRRRGTPKEATVEAWGLVDGQPTSKHFGVLVWDDCVTRESVTTPEQIRKTSEAYRLSVNLGSASPRRRMIGTRYHHADTYGELIRQGAFVPRIYPATRDGTLNGEPVLLSREQYERKVREMGPYTAAAQLLQNPTVDSTHVIRREWLRTYRVGEPARWHRTANIALLVDPANEKKRSSDYTAMAVIGKGQDGNYYLLDAVRDRLDLRERCLEAIRLHRTWRPRVTAWERYGKDADVQALQMVQEAQNYRFAVTEVGGALGKIDRVNRWLPVMAEGKLYLPDHLVRTRHDGRTVDIVKELIEEELMQWPVPAHDDLIDAMSRIFDVTLPWPRPVAQAHDPYREDSQRGTWMSA